MDLDDKITRRVSEIAECEWMLGNDLNTAPDSIKEFNFPITIGRIMQALPHLGFGERYCLCQSGHICLMRGDIFIRGICQWKLTKETGEEGTIADQTEKTKTTL